MANRYKFHSLLVILFAAQLTACLDRNVKDDPKTVRVDFQFGHVFYSLCSKETGEAFVIKGIGSSYDSSFSIRSSDTSAVFHMDSVNVFFERINELKERPMMTDHNMDAPRVEIYSNQQKIFDAHRWNEKFWDIFRPIISELPKGFNPLITDGSPFK